MMKTRIKESGGFTIIEAVISLVILSLILTSVTEVFTYGSRSIAKTNIKRQVAECGTLLVEYLESLPPDEIFKASPGIKINGRFDQASSFSDLQAFVDQSVDNKRCSELSAPPPPGDTGINLRFEICPACQYGCIEGATPGACSGPGAAAMCIFDFQVRLSYDNPLQQSTNQPYKINYRFKRFTGTLDDCLAAGCPTGAPGSGLGQINCNL